MRPRLLTHSFTLDGLHALLRTHAADLPTVYVESETRIELLTLSDALARLGSWTYGRAFGATLEIRWQREDLQIEAHALFEAEQTFAGWVDSPLSARLDAQPRSRTVMLLGRNVAALPVHDPLHDAAGGAWVSDQAGRLLRYPVRDADQKAERVRLTCLDYTVDGYTVLTRLCAIVT